MSSNSNPREWGNYHQSLAMLNISKKPIKDFDFSSYRSGATIFNRAYFSGFNRFLWVFSLFLSLSCFFLPWTQNLAGKGYVTTLQPDSPQTMQSPIPGKIDQWFVREGDLWKGDTLLKISEIKSEYFDPALLMRTEQQLRAKEQAMTAYAQKVERRWKVSYWL